MGEKGGRSGLGQGAVRRGVLYRGMFRLVTLALCLALKRKKIRLLVREGDNRGCKDNEEGMSGRRGSRVVLAKLAIRSATDARHKVLSSSGCLT